jgi:hypothetical protein
VAQLALASLLDMQRLHGSDWILPGEAEEYVCLRGDAVINIRKAMDGKCEILGPNHPSTLTSASDLAVGLHAEGNYNESAELQVQVLNMRHEVLGAEHPDTVISSSRLALSFASVGQVHKAIDDQQDAMMIMKRVLGEEHPTTLLTTFHLAEAMRLCKRLGKPVPPSVRLLSEEDLHRQVLETRQCLFGPGHPDTLTSADALGLSLLGQRRYDEAAEQQKATLDQRREIFGFLHPAAVCNAEILAKTYIVQGDSEAASDMLKDINLERKRVAEEKAKEEERLRAEAEADSDASSHHGD